MAVRVSSQVWVPKTMLGGDAVSILKKKLTVIPRKWAYADEDVPPEPVRLWSETPTEFGMPREYFASTSGRDHEVEWDISRGSPISVETRGLKQVGPYAEQGEAVAAFLNWFADADNELLRPAERVHHMGGLLRAVTGWGKTDFTIALIEKLACTTLIVSHKTFLMSQWADRLAKWMPDARVGLVQENTCDFEDKDIVIASIKSLGIWAENPDRYPVGLRTWPGFVVGDEVHRVGALTWSPTPQLFNAHLRLGLTATPRRKDGCDKVFWWHIGDIVFTAKTERPKPHVKMLYLDSRGPDILHEESVMPPTVMGILTKLNTRNRYIVRELLRAAQRGRKIMVLSERLEHLRVLEEEFRTKACPAAGIEVTTGFYVGEWFTGEDTGDGHPVAFEKEHVYHLGKDLDDGVGVRVVNMGRRGTVAINVKVDQGVGKKPKKAKLRYEGTYSKGRYFLDFGGDEEARRFHPKEVHLIQEDPDTGPWLEAAPRLKRKRPKPKLKQLTREELEAAERAQVIFATYQMCCVDIDVEIVDPLLGHTMTMRESLDYGVAPGVISGRDGCSVVVPCAVGLQGKKSCVEVTVGGSGKERLVLTPDHEIWTHRGWVEAGDLVPHPGNPSNSLGDYVATPRKLDVDEASTELLGQEAWLLGLLMADGSLSCPERGTFEFTSNDPELVEEADRVLRTRGMFLVESRRQHWSTRVVGGSSGPGKKSWLRSELERLGMCKAAADKFIPMELMVAPDKIVKEFLAGYFDGDGCVDAAGRVSFSSISRRLVEQVRTMLLRLAIPTKRPLNDNGCWVVTLGRRESLDVRGVIPMRLERKGGRVGTHDARALGVGDFSMVPPQWTSGVVSRGRANGFMVKDMAHAAGVRANKLSAKVPMLSRERHDAICRLIGEPVLNESIAWLPVRSVVDVGEREVGDFSVPPDKSWAANGLIIHNSEGVDIPAVDVTGLVTPISDIEQAYGRSRRECVPVRHGGLIPMSKCEHLCPWRAEKCTGKPHPVVFDVVDRTVPLARRRAKYRLEYYREVGTKVANQSPA